ncbi:ArsR/SmtB family transcription factor [Gymnodinialimonas sp.]
MNAQPTPIDTYYDEPQTLEEEVPIVASAFAAIGSPHRLSIVLALVRAGPSGLAMGDLGERVGLTGSVLTHHLRPLVTAGLVIQKREGRRILSYVNHPMIEDLSSFLLAECCADAAENGNSGENARAPGD